MQIYIPNTNPACNDAVIIGMTMTMITDKSLTRRQSNSPRADIERSKELKETDQFQSSPTGQ